MESIHYYITWLEINECAEKPCQMRLRLLHFLTEGLFSIPPTWKNLAAADCDLTPVDYQ